MEFAGVQLLIDDYARAKIKDFAQKLVRSESHFNILRDRVYRFFPVMEKILSEEKVPDDFKFLAVQESALLADAVSTSNAVGYWQFKKPTALEMGMVVDDNVDERKNIVAATKGAARYLRRNQIFTKNWIHTLLSYNLGLTGVRNTIKSGEIGASRMDIDGNTHWYVIRCLAHKLVLEQEMSKRPETTLSLFIHSEANGMTLEELSAEMNVPLETMKLYNKWLLTPRVPEGRIYHVVIPVDFNNAPVVSSKVKQELPDPEPPAIAETKPEVKKTTPAVYKPVFKVVNEKKVILAQNGDSEEKLAEEAELRFSRFSRYNDLKAKTTENVQAGEIYYLEKKDKKAHTGYHTVKAGETLWQISQKYGIRYASLLKLNRMDANEKVQPGRILYLKDRRPKDEPVKMEKPVVKKPEEKKSELAVKPVTTVPKTEKNTPEISKSQPNKKDSVVTVKTQKEESPQVKTIEKPQPTENTKSEEKSASQPQYKTHTVALKETLFSISKQYGISVTDLRYWNNLSDTDGIKTGQELIFSNPMEKQKANQPIVSKIPETVADSTKATAIIRQFAPEELTEHIVQPGESLFRIAWDYGMTVPELMSVNEKTESKIKVGEKLKVKTKK
jgi:membrane-bound lytic murein transglycosylase D